MLPPLRDELGGWAGLYALLPGAVLFTWGLITVARGSRATATRRAPGIAVGFAVLTVSICLMGITGWPAISVVGAVAAAIAAGHVNRMLPGHARRGQLGTARATGDDAGQRLLERRDDHRTAVRRRLAGDRCRLAPGLCRPDRDRRSRRLRCRPADAEARAHGRGRRPSVPATVPGRGGASVPCSASRIVVEFCFSYFAVTYLNEESRAVEGGRRGRWRGVGHRHGDRTLRFSVREPPASIVPSAAVIFAGFVLFWGPHSAVGDRRHRVAGLGASPLYPSRITLLIERFPGAMHEGSKRAALAAGSALLVAPALMVSLRAAATCAPPTWRCRCCSCCWWSWRCRPRNDRNVTIALSGSRDGAVRDRLRRRRAPDVSAWRSRTDRTPELGIAQRTGLRCAWIASRSVPPSSVDRSAHRASRNRRVRCDQLLNRFCRMGQGCDRTEVVGRGNGWRWTAHSARRSRDLRGSSTESNTRRPGVRRDG